MRFYSAMGIKKGDAVCIAGAGGKTSLMMQLAKELSAGGYRVLVSTTTRLAADEVTDKFDFFVNINGVKAEAPCPEELRDRMGEYGITLIEADGADRKSLKGWREDEPVIPDFATVTIGVLDISTIGRKPDPHRPEIFYRLTDCGESVEHETIAALANSPDGLFRNSAHTRNVVYLSKTEDEQQMKDAEIVAGMIKDGVTVTAGCCTGDCRIEVLRL